MNVDTALGLETPEGTVIELQPAGIYARSLAFLIDELLRWTIIFATFAVTGFLGVFGQGIRDAQIYAILGQREDALNALRAAIDEGYRTSVISDQWTLPFDPYLSGLRDDPRFGDMLKELEELNDQMYERVLEAEASGEWQALLDMAGAS